MNVTFKRKGRTDYMGFTWFSVYVDGQPLMKDGVHVAYHCLDKEHAMAVHMEINKTKLNLMKGYKNKVTETAFLKWYFSDKNDLRDIGYRVYESLMKWGKYSINVKTLYDQCGYIPQHICKDSDGNNEYDPSEVLLIGEEVTNE